MSESAAGERPRRPNTEWVTRAVIWNQTLWTAGYALTTGGFLTYFGKDLGAGSMMIALLLVIPETMGIVGLAARWVIQRTGNRKRVWLISSLAARVVSLGIPLLALPWWRASGIDPLWMMVLCLALSQAINSIAYVAYLSWLTDLVPESYWGRFFAKRNIAKLCVLLVVPVAGGYLRDWWRREVPAETALLAYVAVFVVGLLFLVASLLPLLRLPNVPVQSETAVLPTWSMLGIAMRDRSLRFLLLHNWWLALANGLTQAAFLGYLFGPLAVGLGTFYVLSGVMRVVKIPTSIAAGSICDRFGNKALLFWGVVVASCAMPFWLVATPAEWMWVFGAYFLWGSYAAVNISGRNLMLKLSPRSDNSAQIVLFRQVSGLLAGVSGLLGGWWLASLQRSGFSIEFGTYRFEGFQLLFAVSFFGRLTAAFWVLPIREPAARGAGWIARALWRLRRHRFGCGSSRDE